VSPGCRCGEKTARWDKGECAAEKIKGGGGNEGKEQKRCQPAVEVLEKGKLKHEKGDVSMKEGIFDMKGLSMKKA
jgi:hypothetical protein